MVSINMSLYQCVMSFLAHPFGFRSTDNGDAGRWIVRRRVRRRALRYQKDRAATISASVKEPKMVIFSVAS